MPPGGSTYKKTYGWRQTIENDNNQSDARKYLRRGRSYTAEHNLINEIGVAMVITGVAVQRARTRRAHAEQALRKVALAA